MAIRKASLVVTRDEAGLQSADVEGIADEGIGGCERVQNFGFSSNPVAIDPQTGKSAESILLDLDAASLPVIIATDDRRYRPRNENFVGDVMMYSIHDTPTAGHNFSTQRIAFTDDGTEDQYRLIIKINNCKIEVKNNGDIYFNTGESHLLMQENGDININCTNLNITSKVNITGDIVTTGSITNNGKKVDSTHTHSGVQPGSGNTGTPT
jgi:phage gp45-like